MNTEGRTSGSNAITLIQRYPLLGIGFGIVAAGPIFEAIGRVGFVVNGGIYVLSFLIYRWGVAELHHAPESDLRMRGMWRARCSCVPKRSRRWAARLTWSTGRGARARSTWTWAATVASWARRGSGCWPRPGSR